MLRKISKSLGMAGAETGLAPMVMRSQRLVSLDPPPAMPYHPAAMPCHRVDTLCQRPAMPYHRVDSLCHPAAMPRHWVDIASQADAMPMRSPALLRQTPLSSTRQAVAIRHEGDRRQSNPLTKALLVLAPRPRSPRLNFGRTLRSAPLIPCSELAPCLYLKGLLAFSLPLLYW